MINNLYVIHSGCPPTPPPPRNVLLLTLLFSNTLGNIYSSQEHLKTMAYAKYGRHMGVG